MRLDWSHPPTGYQNHHRHHHHAAKTRGVSCWTVLHLAVAPVASAAEGGGREQVLTTLAMEVRPQRLHIPSGHCVEVEEATKET